MVWYIVVVRVIRPCGAARRLVSGVEGHSVPIGTGRATPWRQTVEAVTENVTSFVIGFIPQATPA
jgi:hypothetical protein